MKLNPGRCSATTQPECFAILKLFGLKDFFVLLATALETVHYNDLDSFLSSVLLKAKTPWD